jgi:hypothetical protein
VSWLSWCHGYRIIPDYRLFNFSFIGHPSSVFRHLSSVLRLRSSVQIPDSQIPDYSTIFFTHIPHPSSLVISLAQGRSVRSPNVHWLLVCYGAFRKPRAGALGSLTECPLDIRPFGVCELILLKTSKPQNLPTPFHSPASPPSCRIACEYDPLPVAATTPPAYPQTN